MANNDSLDDFFKKKDRKGNKHKKQPGLLTNNEELLKQLVIVTSATSAFKENMDFDDEDEEIVGNNPNRHQFNDESNVININNEDIHGSINKNQLNHNKTKLTVQDSNNNLNDYQTGIGQQDEWEEFDNSNSKYDQLRLKLSRTINDDHENNDDEDYYDENNHYTNQNNNINNIDNENVDNEQSLKNNRRREQQKDKPVWKLDQVKQIETNDIPTEKIEEQQQATIIKSVTTGAYRPPQLRGNSSVTIVSGINSRVSKKEKPNLASTEEFPTLGAAVNKK